MFKSLPQYFREYKLKADVRTLMMLRKSMERGLIRTTGDMYLVLKGLVTNSPKDFGPFTKAFYQYFLEIEIRPGESLDSAVVRSETFKKWKTDWLEEHEGEEPDISELVEQFLNEVHVTTYDIKKMLKGEDILNDDDPDMSDTPEGEEGEQAPRSIQEMADYENISLEELLERMRKVAEQQRRNHEGGSHWIGKGGTSPYGSQGAAKGGIRAGGKGGGKMARKVVGDRNYYPVDTKQILSDNNIDVALAFLKGIQDESADTLLDIPNTIKEGVRQGGLFLPIEKEKIEQKVQVMLFIDNGGWSMSPYIQSVTKLFSKMKRRFAHDLKTYYYHNSIYGGAYSQPSRINSSFEPMEKILKHDKNYSVFIIGDADMAPYELSHGSVSDWQMLEERFPRIVWLNPMQERMWAGSMTITVLRRVFPMFTLSPDGIEKSVQLMNQKRQFWKN